MGLFLCVLEEIDVFVLLEREDEEGGVVSALEEGDSDHPDEGDHTLRGAQQLRQSLKADLLGAVFLVEGIYDVIQPNLVQL